MKKISPERVKHALHNVHNWALSAKSQGATHIFPLLALLEGKLGTATALLPYEESDDFAFWKKYFLVDPGKPKPYFNPITLKLSEEGFPHSNVATIRKNTFRLKWQAANSIQGSSDETLWQLASNYAEIIREKVLRKSGAVHKIPVVDIAVILFRNEDFPDDANAETLMHRFRERFGQRDADFNEMFFFQGEDDKGLWAREPVTSKDYDEVILKELVPEKVLIQSTASPVAIVDDDSVFVQVQQLLELGTSGIIFSGPPGTGKTWYAHRIATKLVNDPEKDIYRVQFHPSYGYEDFVEGFKPDDASKSGFSVIHKTFVDACNRAGKTDGYVIIVIDEINRGDPSRIFGELLTYLERSYRGEKFLLPFSRSPFSIPPRLLILGTMNPYDRSVTHIDAAFMRRFDHIYLEPSAEDLQSMLEENSDFSDENISMIVRWFESAQNFLDVGLGHALFKDIKDLDRLKLVWKYRIKPTVEVLLEFNPANRENFIRSFEALLKRLEGGE